MALAVEPSTAEIRALPLPPHSDQNRIGRAGAARPTERPQDKIETAERPQDAMQTAEESEEIQDRPERVEADIQFANKVATLFNTRISYQYVKELNQVAVKIIERDTEEVVKQIPPEDLIDMRIKLRNSLQGFILDRTV